MKTQMWVKGIQRQRQRFAPCRAHQSFRFGLDEYVLEPCFRVFDVER